VNPTLHKTPGRGPFMRMGRAPHAPPLVGFVVRLPDGTCAKVVGGEVVDVWIVGERPMFIFASPNDGDPQPASRPRFRE
jgi:hypothetical protein